MIKLFLMLLNLTIFNNQNLRPGITGKDYLINDINNPYTKEEIIMLANVNVIYGEEDITNLLKYDFFDYEANINKVGSFNCYFIVEINNETYKYNLKIINRDETIKVIKLNDLYLETTKDNFIYEIDLYRYVEQKLNMKIENEVILDTNYFNEEEDGVYYSLIRFTNNNKEYEIKIEIDVKPKEYKNVKQIVGVSSLVVALAFLIIKKFRKKVI